MAQHFDVAVVGMQTSGIIAAALLAKRGRRVLLVDHGENTTTYKRNGLCLPLLPNLVPTIDQSPYVQRVHEELGMGPELRAVSKPLEPSFQAVMPKHRLDIDSKHEAILAELHHEFPTLVEPVNAFFTKLFALDDELSAFLTNAPPLPPNNWWQHLKYRRALNKVAHLNAPFESDALLAGIPDNHPLRDLLLGPLTFFGHLWGDTPSVFHAVRLISRYFRGVSVFEDGVGGLARLLLQTAERAGVVVRRGAVVQEVRISRRHVTELTIEGERQPHTADYFISNTVAPFHELVLPELRHPKFVMEEQLVRATGSLLVVNLVVKRNVVPCGMAGALFLLNGRRRHRGDEIQDPPLFVQRFAAQRGELGTVRGRLPHADVEHEILSVACPVRVAELAHSPERLAAFKAQVLGRMRRVVPFLDDFLVDTSLPIETSSWDVEGDLATRRVNPWLLHPIFEANKRPILGIAARPVRTFYRNLVHCGRDVVPGLGLEGEYIAGVNAAATLYEIAGRKWKPKTS